MNPEADILDFLNSHRIPWELYRHPPVRTMQECLALREIRWEDARMGKNILLCDRGQRSFHLLITLHDRPFVTSRVSRLLGVSRLSFAPAGRLRELLGLDPGALSPLSLIRDTQKKIRLVCDRDLLAFPFQLFHPGIPTATLRLATDDFLKRFLPAAGHSPVLIDLAADLSGG